MASPVFFSYSWSDEAEAELLDGLLRHRGVPIWRDRRAMRWGGFQQDQVREAIGEICSGFVIYLTPDALDQNGSRFITEVELPAMDERRRIDSTFFSGAIFGGYGVAEGSEEVQRLCGFSISSTFGSTIDPVDQAPHLREAANAILQAYLSTLSGDELQVFFDTRQEVPCGEAADLHLAWHPPLVHDLAGVEEGAWGEDLYPALTDLNSAIRAARAPTKLIISGQPHLSAALSFGYAFRAPGPWQLELVGYDGVRWLSGPRNPDRADWKFDVHAGATGAGSEALVVSLHATHNILDAVRSSRRDFPSARATLDIRPDAGCSHTCIEPDQANALAAAMAAEINSARTRYGAAETHLYMACPWPFSALLGYHLASVGPVLSFEANAARDNYHRACRLT